MDVETIYTLFIGVHALAGGVSLVFGTVILFSRKYLVNRWLFSVYLGALVAMVVFLGGAMGVWWIEYTSVERVAFTLLFGLGCICSIVGLAPGPGFMAKAS